MPPPPEQTAVNAVGVALNPWIGKGLEAVLPLILTLVYLGIYIVLMFELVPNPEIAWGLIGILGPFVGIYLRSAGIVPK